MYSLHYLMNSVYIYSFMYVMGEGDLGEGVYCLVLFANTFYTFFTKHVKSSYLFILINHVLLLSDTEHYLPRLCSIFLYVFFAFFGGGGGLSL